MKTIKIHGKEYILPDNPKWYKGFPPKAGWYPTTWEEGGFRVELLQWFNGKGWTHAACYAHRDSEYVTDEINERADIVYASAVPLFWSDQWWLNQPKTSPMFECPACGKTRAKAGAKKRHVLGLVRLVCKDCALRRAGAKP